MKRDIQNIRESQFVLVYGPGSLIESKNGSRLIPNIKHCLGNKRYYNEDFLGNNEFKEEIRIRNIIKKEENRDKIHLYSIPSNAAQGLSNFKGSYRTSIFPTWQVCHNNKKHKDGVSILYNSRVSENNKCPVCGEDTHSSSVRFVLACPEGHLDEVDWDYAIHHKNNCNPKCSPEYYIWKPKGTGYSEIFVQCSNPNCNAERSIAQIFKDIRFPCTERQPENEDPISFSQNVFFSNPDIKPNKEKGKKHFMRIVQRQSTSLRVANTLTVLKIPKYKRSIVGLIESYEQIKEFLINSDDESLFLNMLKKNNEDDYLLAKEYFKEYPDYDDFKTLVSEIFSDFEKALDIEFNTLSVDEPIKDDDLIKQGFKKYPLKILNKEFSLKICAVDRLTTVTTQLSYQRLPAFDNVDQKTHELKVNPSLSSAFMDEEGEYWYPAYEGVGEGIFITSDKNPLRELDLDCVVDKWENHISDEVILNLKREEIKDPLFVWWHTLSHALINSLSLSCGYNSTALRERVYIKNGKAGILIYNTSPGEDSGMGGLSDTADSFDIILKNAMKSLLHCANDPLCLKRDVQDNGVNGAACHSCLLISETSCEHRNILLDRHFFVD